MTTMTSYDKQLSIKDQMVYSSMTSTHEDLYTTVLTSIKDTNRFLIRKNEDSLKLFLADKAIIYCQKPVVLLQR